MRHCTVCQAPLVKTPDESPANFRKRATCHTKDCRTKHRQALTRKSNERKKRREPEKEKHKRRFVGKVTAAMDSFLRGGH